MLSALLEIERACSRLVTEYCHLIDHGHASQVADLFTPDGIWTSAEKTMRGQDEIRNGFAIRERNAGRRSRHVCNNLLLNVEDDSTVSGSVYLTLYRHDGSPEEAVSPLAGPVMVGEYRDSFVRTGDGWKFRHREAIASFVSERAGQ